MKHFENFFTFPDNWVWKWLNINRRATTNFKFFFRCEEQGNPTMHGKTTPPQSIRVELNKLVQVTSIWSAGWWRTNKKTINIYVLLKWFSLFIIFPDYFCLGSLNVRGLSHYPSTTSTEFPICGCSPSSRIYQSLKNNEKRKKYMLTSFMIGLWRQEEIAAQIPYHFGETWN